MRRKFIIVLLISSFLLLSGCNSLTTTPVKLDAKCDEMVYSDLILGEENTDKINKITCLEECEKRNGVSKGYKCPEGGELTCLCKLTEDKPSLGQIDKNEGKIDENREAEATGFVKGFISDLEPNYMSLVYETKEKGNTWVTNVKEDNFIKYTFILNESLNVIEWCSYSETGELCQR